MQKSSPAARVRRVLLGALVALAAAFTPIATAAAPAQAAPVVGFNPGNIIADSLFYNGSAMTAAEVQTFLNRQLSSCRIGKAPYMPGAKSPSGSGNIIASDCLKSFKQTTSSRTADKYCSGYVGKANETAAQIIAKVGQACGISQKVLLVMLEKEQSLVTDDWPVTRQYNYALGMNCPDSGPGNSANCDAATAGFAMQLYLGARQLKVYKSGGFNYAPFRNNTVKWHPTTSCGTSTFYIENWATASLYIYTPYRPNQAALNAGWGTGNSCSSYGNRNFYNFYKSWFGATTGINYEVGGTFTSYWQTNQAWLGWPTSAQRSITSSGGGSLQDFDGGFLYKSNSGAVVGITRSSPLLTAFAAAGGIEGEWGWPIIGAVNQGTSGNNVMQFQGGAAVESKADGVFLVPTALQSFWEGTGGFNGTLGPPIASAKLADGAVSQKFKKNAVVKPTNGNAVLFEVSLLDAWHAAGGVTKGLGLPTGAAVKITANGSGTQYTLSGATIYSSSAGIFVIPAGKLLTAYMQASGPSGSWGWPRGRQLCAADGQSCTLDFSMGVATWTDLRGVIFTPLDSLSGGSTSADSGEKIVGGAA